MALSITSIVRDGGPDCQHITVTLDHEGVSRTFQTSFSDIDTMLARLTPVEQLKLLVTLWAKYRRVQGRTVVGVEIG